MLVRLTMICSGATPATRKGSFPLDEALEPQSLALAAAMTLRRADRVWTSPALRRGMIYSWEVVAVRNGQEVRSPVAPAPRAQFKILEAEKLLELTNLKKHKPISHLTLGLTFARFGLLVEAEGQLQILARENPNSPIATRLLRTVQEWSKR